MYEKEAADLAEKLEKMVEAKEDEYVIRKHQEVLEESKAMTPDTRNRLTKAIQDLKSELVVSVLLLSFINMVLKKNER